MTGIVQRWTDGARLGARVACIAWAMALSAGQALGQDAALSASRADLKRQANGALAVLALSAAPNETASFLRIDTGQSGDTELLTAQVGGDFTYSEETPLFLEGYLGYARYNPTFIFRSGGPAIGVETEWNNFAATGGVGWDFRIAPELVLRPIANISFGSIQNGRFSAIPLASKRERAAADFLNGGTHYAFGYGGSLMLDYERYREDHMVDVELRYTFIRLQSIGGSSSQVKGAADAESLGLWTRLRVPTGVTVLGRPLRLVGEVAASALLGDQRFVVGSDYLVQVGGGVEFDLTAIGWSPVERTRLLGRYVLGDGVSGFSIGIGLSF